MASEGASLTFRAAQPDDYEGVLAMSGPGHYEGYDYIPDWYDMLVRSPNRRSFVGEIGKKIVSTNAGSTVAKFNSSTEFLVTWACMHG